MNEYSPAWKIYFETKRKLIIETFMHAFGQFFLKTLLNCCRIRQESAMLNQV